MTPVRRHPDEDRPVDFSGRGGWGRFFDRVFENPQNPLGWSLKLFEFKAITVRVHLVTVIYLVGLLLWSIPPSHGGLMFAAPSLLALFVLVMIHEFGHCFAARFAGGEADRIVMLPWGGLALTQPPETWKGHLITTIGGPMVHVVIAPLTITLLYFLGLGQTVLFNPLNLTPTLTLISDAGSTIGALAKVTLWWFHAVNLILLAFNVLLPMYPFDGGRIVHALMWRSIGRRRASEVAVIVGFVGAMILGIAAVFMEDVMLLLIAGFGAMTCWIERRRIRGEVELAAGGLTTGGYAGNVDDDEDIFVERGPTRAEIRRAEAAKQEQEELDRILAKISAEGKDSLTRQERKTLDQISKNKRSSGT